MVFIVFSAYGPEFSANDFVKEHGPKDSSVWSKGQPRRAGKLYEDAGFSLILDEAETNESVLSIQTFLKNNQGWLAALRKQPVERLFHLGVTVGEERSYAPTLEFDLSFLKELADEQINLNITAYPASDSE